MSIGSNLIAIRKSKNISRKELAEILNIPYTTLRNYETDDREPKHETLCNIAKALDVPVFSLYDGYELDWDSEISDDDPHDPADLQKQTEAKSPPALTDEEQELVDGYRGFNRDGQTALLNTVRGWQDFPGKTSVFLIVIV